MAVAPTLARAEPVAVKYTEGVVHGFLVLRTLEGTPIADGDMTQVPRGGRVTNHLVFHFRDGSLHDEKVVFTQHGYFRLVSYHLLQKGPSFQRSMEVTLDGASGKVSIRYTDEDGKEKALTPDVKVPDDVSNGLRLHTAEKYRSQGGAHHGVLHGGCAQASAGEICSYSAGGRAILHWEFCAQGEPLPDQGGRRRGRRPGGAVRG